MVERRTENPGVASPILASGTKNQNSGSVLGKPLIKKLASSNGFTRNSCGSIMWHAIVTGLPETLAHK